MRLVLIGSVMVIALALGACGGPAGGSAAVSSDDIGGVDVTDEPTDPGTSPAGAGGTVGGLASKPCDLLTTTEMESIVGGGDVTLTPVLPPADGIQGLCGYRSSESGNDVTVGVGEGENATSLFITMAYLADNGADAVSRVDGIGDEAVYSDGTLAIRKGDAVVNVTVNQSNAADDAALREVTLELGRAIAGKL